jgi:hypothetical protein
MKQNRTVSEQQPAAKPRQREWLLAVLAALPPFLLGLFVYRQGFNMLDDGLWLLGGRVLFEGGALYRDLFSIYGPARYLLLVPFFPIFGVSALSLAMLKACCDAFAAGWAFRAARRLGAGHWAWLVPVGVMALGPFQPRYVALLGLALLVTSAIRKGTNRTWLLCGLAWGFVALFGVDGAVYGTIVAGGAMAFGWKEKTWTWSDLARLMTGFGAVFFAAILMLIVRGAGGEAWWDLVVYPLTRFQDAMGINWWDTFLRGPELGIPFAHLTTGEVLPGIWSGHGAGVTLSIRALFMGLGFVPPLALYVAWRRGKIAMWGPWVAFALTGWLTMAGRGGGLHLKVAWLGTLVLVVGLIGSVLPALSRRWLQSLTIVAALLVLTAGWGTFLQEKLWLAGNADRPGLQQWDRPGARVAMDETRISVIEQVFAELTSKGRAPLASPDDPLLIWPAQPGLYAIMDRPLASNQATLLAGEVRDPARVISQLESNAPPVAILGKTRGLVSGVHGMGELAPELWVWMRDHFRIVREFREKTNEFKLCAFEPEGRDKLLTIPLVQRLPDVEIRVLNKMLTPEMGSPIGQSFRVGPSDLAGLIVRFLIEGEGPAEVPMRLQLWGKTSPDSDANDFQSFDRLMGQMESTIRINKTLEKIEFPFNPVPSTAGQDVMMTLEIMGPPTQPIGLGCHLFPDENPDNDLYPEGTAFVNGRPVMADLYLLTY